MGSLNDAEATADMRRRAATLNALPAADYAGALRLKLDYARRLYEDGGRSHRATAEYRDFVSRNSTWLLPIRRLLHPARPAPHARLPPVGRIRTVSPHTHKAPRKTTRAGNRPALLRAVSSRPSSCATCATTATSKGYASRGDIPIGISPTSVDAWQWPRLFNLDTSAGAPPDPFARLGQNWGFPTYNWQAIPRRIRVVACTVRQDGRLLRRLPHRPYTRIFPHLADSVAADPRPARHFQPRTAADTRRDARQLQLRLRRTSPRHAMDHRQRAVRHVRRIHRRHTRAISHARSAGI